MNQEMPVYPATRAEYNQIVAARYTRLATFIIIFAAFGLLIGGIIGSYFYFGIMSIMLGGLTFMVAGVLIACLFVRTNWLGMGKLLVAIVLLTLVCFKMLPHKEIFLPPPSEVPTVIGE